MLPQSKKAVAVATALQGGGILTDVMAEDSKGRAAGFTFPRLYAIIDPAQASGRSVIEIGEILLSAGIRLIQLRDKQASSRELYEHARRLSELVRAQRGTCIVNDRADVARAAGADGVHVGQDDLPVELARRVIGPGKLVVFSTHVLAQVRDADRSSADYVAFGPIFPTSSKERPDPVVGLAGLREARKATRKPLVAIGGITVQNAREVIEAGADSVAVISDLLKAGDLHQRAEEFLKAVGEV